MRPPNHLLYLHGFLSSPQSSKAVRMASWLAQYQPQLTWYCPKLPVSPGDAMRQVFDHIAGWPHDGLAVVGSSLGGFYASVVAERMGCPAVVLNPAVNPARDLAGHVGKVNAWHGDESFEFRAEFIDELRALTPAVLTRPERYFAVIAKGDSVLDWREMTARYTGCETKLLEGGDHQLSDFDVHLPDVLRFLHLA
ncbi:MAG: esterase [Burkholderiaceae bacterium]|nr:esterase [Burkholderiaceae bacterium]MDH3459681.1 esterase [Burkholderiaceae bacterium]